MLSEVRPSAESKDPVLSPVPMPIQGILTTVLESRFVLNARQFGVET